jgi:hypothetical protein
MCGAGTALSKHGQASGPVGCGARSFVPHGAMSTAETRILHVHIEKTGGTALRMALQRALGPGARRFPQHHESKLAGIVPDDWDLLSGHFGYGRLAPLGGRVVVLLRDPVDRFMSVYYYWREVHARGTNTTRQTALATQYGLDDFIAVKDEVSLLEQFFNRMTWQLADTFSLNGRQKLRNDGMTDSALLALAVQNLRACHVVGVQERMDAFAGQFERRIGRTLVIDKLNVTQQRAKLADLPAQTRRRIMEWIYLDVELYQAACALAAAG